MRLVKTKAIAAIALMLLSLLCSAHAYGNNGRWLARMSARASGMFDALPQRVGNTVAAGTLGLYLICGGVACNINNEADVRKPSVEVSAEVVKSLNNSDRAVLIARRDVDLAKLDGTLIEEANEGTIDTNTLAQLQAALEGDVLLLELATDEVLFKTDDGQVFILPYKDSREVPLWVWFITTPIFGIAAVIGIVWLVVITDEKLSDGDPFGSYGSGE